jgi:hypothetical protein
VGQKVLEDMVAGNVPFVLKSIFLDHSKEGLDNEHVVSLVQPVVIFEQHLNHAVENSLLI